MVSENISLLQAIFSYHNKGDMNDISIAIHVSSVPALTNATLIN